MRLSENGGKTWETKAYIPADKERAFKLARVLDVTPEYLMCEDDSDFMIVEKNELQREIAQMEPDQLARLLEYALFLKNKKDGAE